VVYGCSTAAVAYFVSAAATELAGHGIRVNGVAPRADTPMMTEATQRLIEVAGDEGLNAVFAAVRSAPPSATARQEPHSISPLVVWLASQRSKPLTGKVFSAAGGRIALEESWREGAHVTLPAAHSVLDVEREVAGLLRTT
jgi:NAD(P)-dependent dehydrogenase (short-subunit alcohol dehydrogenase family)